jgi:MFS family permease
VANSLPALREDLNASLGDLEWTVNAYNLAFAVLLLTGAALGDRYGRKRMYWIGLLGFTLASVGAAVSPSVGALIAARGVQGAAAAIVMPMTLTLISGRSRPRSAALPSDCGAASPDWRSRRGRSSVVPSSRGSAGIGSSG